MNASFDRVSSANNVQLNLDFYLLQWTEYREKQEGDRNLNMWIGHRCLPLCFSAIAFKQEIKRCARKVDRGSSHHPIRKETAS